MTLAEAGEIFAYWEQSPPAHLLLNVIARMLGWRPAAAATSPAEAFAGGAPPGLTIARGGGFDMPAPVLDADALRARNRARAVAIARRQHRPGADR